jgi:hypothetical protein
LQIFRRREGQSQTEPQTKPFLKAREGGVVDQSVLGVDQVQGSTAEEGFPTGGALRTGVLFREIDKLIVELLEDIVHEKTSLTREKYSY